jgi:tetratricopeptide (TPR) repeat protein
LKANLQLGLLYSKQYRNLEEAVRLLEKARSIQPNLAGSYAALGSAYLQFGNARQAAVALEGAIRLAPENAELFYVLASAHRQRHEEAKAKTALDAFDTRKKAEAEQGARDMRSRANYEEGVNLLSNTDQLDKAYEMLAQAVKERPGFAPGYYRMVQVSYLKAISPTHSLQSVRLCG